MLGCEIDSENYPEMFSNMFFGVLVVVSSFTQVFIYEVYETRFDKKIMKNLSTRWYPNKQYFELSPILQVEKLLKP